MVAPEPGPVAGAARAASTSGSWPSSGRSGPAGSGRDTPLPCPARPPHTHPLTRWGSAGRRLPVEHLVDDRPRVPGDAPVVVEELAGVHVGSVAAGPGDAHQLEPRSRQLVAGPAAHQED